MQRDFAGQLRARVRLAGEDGRFERLQKNVVERQSERDLRDFSELGHIGP
jgi:hypothetical protein